MGVCMYEYDIVCMGAWVYVCMSMTLCAWVYVCMYEYDIVCMGVCMYVCMSMTSCVWVHEYDTMYVWVYVCMDVLPISMDLKWPMKMQ